MKGTRTPTGIPGLDKFIEGGFEKDTVNLVAGKTGAGKTIFALQFICQGMLKYKDKGIYMTPCDNLVNVKKQCYQFGWDIDKLSKKKLFLLIELDPLDLGLLIDKVLDATERFPAERIAIDPMSMFELYMKEPYTIRKDLLKLMKRLRETGRTNLITTEIPESGGDLSRFGVIEFMADTVILLDYLALAKQYKRNLAIRKMRLTKHSMDIHPFRITSKGIEVLR